MVHVIAGENQTFRIFEVSECVLLALMRFLFNYAHLNTYDNMTEHQYG